MARDQFGSAKVAGLNADFARSLNGASSRSRVGLQSQENSVLGVDGIFFRTLDDSEPLVGDVDDRSKRLDDGAEETDESHSDDDKRLERTAEEPSGPSDAESQIPIATSDQGAIGDADAAATSELTALLTRQPLTIETLNSVILLGGQSPRFSLVAPDQRPGAKLLKPASEAAGGQSTRLVTEVARSRELAASVPEPHSKKEPSTLPLHGARPESSQPRERGDLPRETKPQAREPSDGVSSIARPLLVPREASQSATAQIAPVVVASGSAPRSPASSESRTSSTAAGAIGSANKLLERLDPSASARAATPALKADGDFERQLALQLQRGVTEALRSPGGTLTLRLQPAHLGQLRVQVKIDADQNLRARFEVASAKTRSALNGSLDELVAALGEKGVRVEDIAVTLRPQLPDRDLGLPPVGPETDVAGSVPTSASEAQGMPKDAGPAFANGFDQSVGAESGGAHSENSSQRGSSQDAASAGSAAAYDISTPPAEPALDLFPIGQPVGLIGSVLHVAPDGRVRVDATA